MTRGRWPGCWIWDDGSPAASLPLPRGQIVESLEPAAVPAVPAVSAGLFPNRLHHQRHSSLVGALWPREGHRHLH